MKSDHDFFIKTAAPIVRHEKMQSTKKLIQHGNVSVFAHSVAVAKYSIMLAKQLGIRCDKRSLIRGALLHDFFLYDWHKINNVGDGLHGFAHPNTASKNAARHFKLNKKEKRLALKSALSDRANEEKIVVLDELKLDEIKTKKFKEVLTNLNLDKVLVVLADNDKNAVLSARNIPKVKTAQINELNVYDILKYQTVLFTKDSLKKTEEVYA